MASNCHIGSLFFISGSKVAAVFPRGLFDEKSNISPPLIWLRVPMAKFVFVCVCIVFYLCISCLSMCNCICIWSVFVWFHHQASPAAHSPPLLTSRHLPAKFTAVRWQFAAPFINELFRKLRGAPQFLETTKELEKWASPGPKKWLWGPKKDVFSRIHIAGYFLQKTASKLVKFGRGSSVSDLHQPIGGPHPVLYFTTQMTEKYSTAMC